MTSEKTADSEASELSDGLEPASRCPDFDGDCAGVVDHLQCWKGLKSERAGVVYFTGPADGYCPFVIGMEPKGANVQGDRLRATDPQEGDKA